jgi:choline dehydrogenase
MLPYLKKSVTFTPPDLTKRGSNATTLYDENSFDSPGGPVQVSFSNFAMPFSSWAALACKAAGFPVASGFSNGVLNGSQYSPVTVDPVDETRSSSETSFLREALEPSDTASYQSSLLQIYLLSQAQKILFDDNNTAIGVNVSTGGVTYVLSAKKEVILSAGVFHSPQLLMVSGIGPRATLERFDIPIISDLPGVGQGMHDSATSGSVVFPVDVLSTAVVNNDPIYRAQATAEYLQNQSGILTTSGTDYWGP